MANPKDVFVVHGHDHGMKETVARFLSTGVLVKRDPLQVWAAERVRELVQLAFFP
jgi:hypothetical protein